MATDNHFMSSVCMTLSAFTTAYLSYKNAHGRLLSRREIRNLPSAREFIRLDHILQDLEDAPFASWHQEGRLELENKTFDAELKVLVDAVDLIHQKSARDPILYLLVIGQWYHQVICIGLAIFWAILQISQVWYFDHGSVAIAKVIASTIAVIPVLEIVMARFGASTQYRRFIVLCSLIGGFLTAARYSFHSIEQISPAVIHIHPPIPTSEALLSASIWSLANAVVFLGLVDPLPGMNGGCRMGYRELAREEQEKLNSMPHGFKEWVYTCLQGSRLRERSIMDEKRETSQQY